MLVLLLSIVLIAGIGIFSYRCKQNNSRLQTKFNQVIGLRQLIQLLRFHRRQTHLLLNNLRSSDQDKQALNESLAIQALMKTLINQSEMIHKPMYRILMKRITVLLDEWPRYSLHRNQLSHGKAIRHVMYLIDDTITQGLLYADKDTQFKHYQTIWPIVLNAIDSLSRFRYAIENYRPELVTAHQRDLKLHASIIHRRLEQIALLSHHPVPTIAFDSLREEFDAIPLKEDNLSQNKTLLYEYSLKLSDTIYLLFDMVLVDIANDISVHLPPLPTQTEQNIITQLNAH